MAQIFVNNGSSTLSAGALSTDTSIFIQPGQGGRFPVVAAPNFAYATLEDASGNVEILKITDHAANATSFTVVRAQQGTTARAYSIGDLFELRPTAAEATAWEADIDNLQAFKANINTTNSFTGLQTFLAGISVAGGGLFSGTFDYTGATINVAMPVAANNAVNKSYADGLAFATALPNQTGNAGLSVTTDGTTAAWGMSAAESLAVFNFVSS